MLSLEPISRSIGSPEINSSPVFQAKHVSTQDTLRAAEALVNPLDWKPERPVLLSPQELPLSKNSSLSDCRLIRATEEARSVGNKVLDTYTLRLATAKERIREISTENLQKLKENAERSKSSAFWSTMQKISAALTFALSFFTGISLVPVNPIVGSMMIFSGIVSLTNFAMTEAGTWNWIAEQISHDNEDLKRKFVTYLPLAVGILAAGVGLGAPILAGGASLFAHRATSIAQGAFAVFNGLVTFGKGQADARLLWKQAEQTLIQEKLTLESSHYDTLMRQIEGSLNEFKAIKAKSKKTIELISQSNIQLVRQV